MRSEEHTSELQSRLQIVCRLLLEKKTIGIIAEIIVRTYIESENFFFYTFRKHRDLHSFPTRRSSDLGAFALSNNIFIIAIGLGIGAMFVRSMTVMLVDKGTLSEYRFLEHGADEIGRAHV